MKKKKFFCAFLLFGQIFLAKAQVKVTFKTGLLPASKTPFAQLFLAGNFNGWDPAGTAWKMALESDGHYQLTQTLATGIYSYKTTRGSWQMVECDATGKGIDNRTLKLNHDTTVVIDIAAWQDNFAPVEKKHTATAQVHIITDKFDMPQLGRQRRLWVYLPVGYEKSARKYPVLYMHDGQNLFDDATSGYGEWGIDEFMAQVPSAQQCIIIGIDHGGDHRIAEYSPYDSKYGKAEGGAYLDFIVKTLKPYIDAHYRTRPDVNHTAIAGSSMGGLISLYAALKYPKVFGNAGVFSPSLWLDAQMYPFAESKKITRTGFYFACGDAESDSMVSDMQKMITVVRKDGVSEANSPVVIVPGASHNEKQWQGEFPAFYQWLVGRWK